MVHLQRQARAAHPASTGAPELERTIRRLRRGGAGNAVNAGRIEDLDQNRELRGDKWYGTPNKLGVAGQMMRDAHVRQSIAAVRDPLAGAQWEFEAASDDPVDVEAANYCRWVFFELNSWDRTLFHVTQYLRDGFALVEPTDDVVTLPKNKFPLHRGGGRGVVYTGFHERAAWSVSEWKQSASNPTQIAGIRQWIGGSDEEEAGFPFIPSDQLLRFTWDQEGANYAGLAPLRPAAGPWKAKILLTIVDMIRHEREGTGVPRVSLPENPEEGDIAKAELILSEMRANDKGYLILPYGFEFAWETTKGISTGLGEAIERCNRDIAFNTGTAWMLFGGAGNGSWALATEHKGQYALSLEKHARFIETGFNIGCDGWSIIARLVRLNYGPDVGIPRLIARNMPTRDWQRILPIVYQLGLSGFLRADDTTEAFMRRVLHMPQHDPKTARESKTQLPAQNAGAGVEPKEDTNESAKALLDEFRGIKAELFAELQQLLSGAFPQLADQVIHKLAAQAKTNARAGVYR